MKALFDGLALFWAGLKDTWKSAGWIIVIVLASFGVCVALIEVFL